MSVTKIDEEKLKKLGLYIKEIRERKGFGTNQFAAKIDVSPSYITKLEKGNVATVHPYLLKRVADGLRIDYKELYRIVDYLEQEISDTFIKGVHKGEKGNVKFLDHKVVDLPVYGRASAGDGYINLENQISTKRVIANGFSPESFIVEVTGDSMSYEINDGDWAVVDPQQKDYIENKVYVVTYEGETFIKQIICPAKGMVVLKSFNRKYEDKYVMKDSLDHLKVEGRVVKVISEKRF